ncbi:DUF3800 domain-containing protein [Methylobacterium sp. E-066]|uniref:DUF3800 domain-containing protein n=1 Tax=Methylobacterium sp. E-066 TaxID=2836584 RepID=UPI001FBACFC7|nr:DUF3800 domain-containing protein [Methylobacterium sp. E-066]MCJ2138758.1 DUF3800 domain-containing protein [Methylobacterium sp. E-066]
MHLIYLDESGNTGARKDPDQPIHLIAALCVHESRIRAIEMAVREIVKARFGVLVLTEGFELHAADLYGGNGFFKGIRPDQRIGCIHDILDALATHDVAVLWAAVDKMKLHSSRHPHRMAFLFLVERLEDWLSRAEPKLGLLVADENKEIEQKLIDDLEIFKLSGTNMGWRPTQISSIVDSIHFVQSTNNRLIQCVDIVAYFSLKYYRQEQRLIQDFRVASLTNVPWPTWREAQLDAAPSKKAIHQIGRKLDALTVGRKVFP